MRNTVVGVRSSRNGGKFPGKQPVTGLADPSIFALVGEISF
jgi:hypothetical protein